VIASAKAFGKEGAPCATAGKPGTGRRRAGGGRYVKRTIPRGTINTSTANTCELKHVDGEGPNMSRPPSTAAPGENRRGVANRGIRPGMPATVARAGSEARGIR